MLKSRLGTNYPCLPIDSAKRWVKGVGGVNLDIVDPTLIGRLGAWAQSRNSIIEINSGTRSLQRQTELYIESGGKLVNGQWTGGNGKVAKPGKSWHNFALAVDTSSAWAKAINKTESTKLQKELLTFGLFKPMTQGNGMSVLEDWHIQPIETLDVPLEKRKAMMPYEEVKKEEVKLEKKESTVVSDWAKDAHEFVIENKISDGTNPQGPVTREQLWVTMFNFYNLLKKEG